MSSDVTSCRNKFSRAAKRRDSSLARCDLAASKRFSVLLLLRRSARGCFAEGPRSSFRLRHYASCLIKPLLRSRGPVAFVRPIVGRRLGLSDGLLSPLQNLQSSSRLLMAGEPCFEFRASPAKPDVPAQPQAGISSKFVSCSATESTTPGGSNAAPVRLSRSAPVGWNHQKLILGTVFGQQQC